MKTCSGCRQAKAFDDFHKCSRAPDGYNWWCKPCSADIRRKSYLKHRDKTLEVNAIWRDANRARMRALANRWKIANPERFKALVDRWRNKPINRLHASVSVRIKDSLRGTKKGKGVEKIIGYKISELHSHLERQFSKGMDWENYGRWHIDHIVPLSSFGPDDVRTAWALPNLRPLWAIENQRKFNKRTHLL